MGVSLSKVSLIESGGAGRRRLLSE
jgi:hypothetical protein